MSNSGRESTVSLEALDDHLKAILKLKIREFVHLSPWFRNIPVIDATYYPKTVAGKSLKLLKAESYCPNRHLLSRRRPHVRVVMI